jgi:hypothetical protein
VLEVESGFLPIIGKFLLVISGCFKQCQKVCLSILFLHPSKFPCLVQSLWMMRWPLYKKLADLLAKGAVFLVIDNSWGFVWAYFSVPMPRSRSFRPIINLKPLNQFIRYLHFKMESLDSVRFLVKKGDWFVKLDLKDAYLTIPLHPTHQKFLRFEWRGSISVSVHGVWSRSSAPCFHQITLSSCRLSKVSWNKTCYLFGRYFNYEFFLRSSPCRFKSGYWITRTFRFLN